MENKVFFSINSVSRGSRIAWIDNIRLFAILCVIFGHCWYLGDSNALGGYEVAGYHFQKLFIVSFNMPLFVFLSGYCAYNGITSIKSFDSLVSYWKKIAMRIAIPTFLLFMLEGVIGRIQKQDYLVSICLLGIIIAVFISYYLYRHSARRILKGFFPILSLMILFVTAIYSSFWFPTMLLQIMILISFFVYLRNNNKAVLSVLFAVVSIISLFLFSSKLPYTEEFILYFALGLLLKHYGVFSESKSFPYVTSIISFLLALALMFVVGDNDFYALRFSSMSVDNGYHYFVIRQLCAVSWIVFFCSIFKRFININKWQLISYLGGATLPLYLIHAFIKSYTFPFIHITSRNDMIIWLLIILVFIALFCASTLLILLFRKNEITKVLLLGEKA